MFYTSSNSFQSILVQVDASPYGQKPVIAHTVEDRSENLACYISGMLFNAKWKKDESSWEDDNRNQGKQIVYI